MDAAGIQAKINRGASIASGKLGQPFAWFRAYGSASPLDPACQMGTLLAYLDPNFTYDGKKPNGYNKPLWGALFDRTLTQGGDYLQGGQGTFFLAAQQPLLPTLAVECNAVISVARPGGIDLAHEDSYGGQTMAGDLPLLTRWPASVLAGGRTQAGTSGLPGDAVMKGKELLFPAAPGVLLRVGDLVTTDAGERLTLTAAERTDLGWRASAVLSEV